MVQSKEQGGAPPGGSRGGPGDLQEGGGSAWWGWGGRRKGRQAVVRRGLLQREQSFGGSRWRGGVKRKEKYQPETEGARGGAPGSPALEQARGWNVMPGAWWLRGVRTADRWAGVVSGSSASSQQRDGEGRGGGGRV